MSKKEFCSFYNRLILLLLWTMFFGYTLWFQDYTLTDQIKLFPTQTMAKTVAVIMIIMPVIKLTSIVILNRKKSKFWIVIKKWSLILIATIWLVITWAYLFNDVPNVGYVMSSFISFDAYAELGRGVYDY